MKTGRVRKKEGATPEPKEPAPRKEPATKPAASKPSRPRPSTRKTPAKSPARKTKPPYLILAIMGAIFVCFVIFIIIMNLRGGADEWVEANRANGSWTATITVFGPQVQVIEMWENECIQEPNGTVRAGTCVRKDAKTHQDKVVDDYEEYAYNIYYEETWSEVYQAQGTNFTITSLGTDDWWEGDLHYTRVEELDEGSCEYTNYAVWVDDPNNKSQESEVYLAECEVWDHVVVKERVYDQTEWCQCDVTTLTEIGRQSEQGTGVSVRWPNPIVPRGGNTERSFKGQVTFLGDDHSYTTTTDNWEQYQDYLTDQYYIGLKDGKPVKVSKNPKD